MTNVATGSTEPIEFMFYRGSDPVIDGSVSLVATTSVGGTRNYLQTDRTLGEGPHSFPLVQAPPNSGIWTLDPPLFLAEELDGRLLTLIAAHTPANPNDDVLPPRTAHLSVGVSNGGVGGTAHGTVEFLKPRRVT